MAAKGIMFGLGFKEVFMDRFAELSHHRDLRMV
jgi:hypothetical protein